jgi:hypothetical protein
MTTTQPERSTDVDRREVRELAEASQSLAEPPEPQEPTFDPLVHIRCHDYAGHRAAHVRGAAGWRCRRCEPEIEDLI